jgi:aflatoxin B1 aldehyde reductase
MAIKAVLGGAGILPPKYPTDNDVKALFDAIKKVGVTTIDTARLYGPSEEIIGRIPGHEDFVIDTKLKGGFGPGSVTKENVIADSEDSLKKVGIKQFDILYIHAPDDTVPIAETLEAINEVYKKGIFKRFGLSNFTAAQVQEVYDISKANGYPLPSVFQGNYNPISRHIEEDLFPVLRKLGIAFYAYSPIAGGFLTKSKAQIDSGEGRFNAQAVGGMYLRLYNKPSLVEALAEWNDIADKEGISKAELAYRWVGYNSALDEKYGDAVIFGASSVRQAEETAAALKKGPISAEAAKRIEQIWKNVEQDAPVNNFASDFANA